jgi:hypothetical protein
MKPQYYFLLANFLLASAILDTSFAQDENKLMVVDRTASPSSIPALENSGVIKILFIESVEALNLNKTNVNAKVLRAFTATFQNASDLAWYAYDKKDKWFLAMFNNNGRKYQAVYKKDGYLEYAISEGSEKDLSKDDKKLIKKDYYDYTIIRAIEILTEKTASWTINLQKGNEVIIVNVSDGWYEEVAHYKLPGKDQNKDLAQKD